MNQHALQFTRRQMLGTLAAAGGAWWAGETAWGQKKEEPLPVAGVVTVYRKNSHADVILGKILNGFDQQGGPGPNLKLVSLYVDQSPPNDLGKVLAEKHGFRLAKTIDEALTLGGKQLAVAGVLSIGEHGDYPYTEDTKQHQYPRKRFFDEIVKTFQRVDAVVPVFNDKHLSYRWDEAKAMYDTAREMKIPFLAGSSAPVAWREPGLQLERNTPLESALALGYGGLESYGFHAVETLQCMVERRKGGETGVKSVQAVSGDEIIKAEQAGRWSKKLLDAALEVVPLVKTKGNTPQKEIGDKAVFFLIEYNDGLQAAVGMSTGRTHQFAFAAQVKGSDKPVATWFRLQEEVPYGHFTYLVKAIEHTIRTGQPAYPVERTLLTTGILDAAQHSHAAGGKRLETPQLSIRYQPADWPYAPGKLEAVEVGK